MINRLLPKVLVVDDEPAVRMFFREALKPIPPRWRRRAMPPRPGIDRER